MNGTDQRSTFERVKDVIVERLDAHESDVKPEARLADDLAVDSLDRIDLTMAIEEEFGVEITDDEAEFCTTVQTIVDLVERKAA